MREAITDTIREQLKRNATWTDAAKALYDGYEHGNVVRPQQLPKYLSAVRYATQGSPEALAEARKVFYNIERLSKSGAPTKSLKAAYNNLLKTAQTGTEKQLEKACYTAIEEKSRYVAQRIIRTELARAYSDGFNAKILQDDDVVAVRLKLSTRHPVFDICDLFAEADMYGLGKGVYPKDKALPIPLHPYCMCRLEEVFKWEVDISKQKDNIKQAGDTWLSGISDENRRLVLGIEGNAMWKDGENWQNYMRNWNGLAEPKTRLKKAVKDVKIVRSRGKTFVFNLQLFAQKDYWVPPAEYAMITKELNTWLAGKKCKGKTIPWAAGNDIYTVKVVKYGTYRIIGKRAIDSDMEEWIDENDR